VMKNFLLGLSKFVLGIILAMLIVSLAGLSMARYFMTRMVELPDRPTYDNELPESPAAAKPAAESAEAQPAAEEPAAELPEGAYRAIVVSAEGLVVRAGPGTDYEQLGGLDYEQSVDVLSEESGWQKIDFGGGQEGWIKGGNTERE
jgi:hypothetical protein